MLFRSKSNLQPATGSTLTPVIPIPTEIYSILWRVQNQGRGMFAFACRRFKPSRIVGSDHKPQQDAEKAVCGFFSHATREARLPRGSHFQWLTATENGDTSVCRTQAAEQSEFFSSLLGVCAAERKRPILHGMRTGRHRFTPHSEIGRAHV